MLGVPIPARISAFTFANTVGPRSTENSNARSNPRSSGQDATYYGGSCCHRTTPCGFRTVPTPIRRAHLLMCPSPCSPYPLYPQPILPPLRLRPLPTRVALSPSRSLPVCLVSYPLRPDLPVTWRTPVPSSAPPAWPMFRQLRLLPARVALSPPRFLPACLVYPLRTVLPPCSMLTSVTPFPSFSPSPACTRLPRLSSHQ